VHSNNTNNNSNSYNSVRQHKSSIAIATANSTAAEHLVHTILENYSNIQPHFRKRAASPATTLSPKAPKKTKAPRKSTDKRRHPHSNQQECAIPAEELVHPTPSPLVSPATPVQRKRMKNISTHTATEVNESRKPLTVVNHYDHSNSNRHPHTILTDSRPTGRPHTDTETATASEHPAPPWPREGVG
jgi:hypothetical protein